MPERWQSEMKRMRIARQFGNNSFATEKPEYALLDSLVKVQMIIEKSHPTIIHETHEQDIIDQVCTLGYSSERLSNSPNVLFRSN
jgi:hypothetical protein